MNNNTNEPFSCLSAGCRDAMTLPKVTMMQTAVLSFRKQMSAASQCNIEQHMLHYIVSMETKSRIVIII